jgi:hypothetical protein
MHRIVEFLQVERVAMSTACLHPQAPRASCICMHLVYGRLVYLYPLHRLEHDLAPHSGPGLPPPGPLRAVSALTAAGRQARREHGGPLRASVQDGHDQDGWAGWAGLAGWAGWAGYKSAAAGVKNEEAAPGEEARTEDGWPRGDGPGRDSGNGPGRDSQYQGGGGLGRLTDGDMRTRAWLWRPAGTHPARPGPARPGPAEARDMQGLLRR